MGNNTNKERLLKYIDTSQIDKILYQIAINPELLNQDLATDINQTPLARAVWRNDTQLVQCLLNNGVDINNGGSSTITPLMWACKRDNQNLVALLIQSGAQIELNSKDHFTALDYSILHGNYRPALFLYEFTQNIQDFTVYYQYSKIHDYRYVNYEMMITHLKLATPYDLLPNIYEKPKKQKLLDPVVDPRESWGDFLYRQIEFQNPPLVERTELPENLQPQNRVLGKIRQQINGLPINTTKPQSYCQISPQQQKVDSQVHQNQLSFT